MLTAQDMLLTGEGLLHLGRVLSWRLDREDRWVRVELADMSDGHRLRRTRSHRTGLTEYEELVAGEWSGLGIVAQ